MLPKRILEWRAAGLVAGLCSWLALASTAAAGAVTFTGTVPADFPVGTPVPMVIPLPDGEWDPLFLQAVISIGGVESEPVTAQFETNDPTAGTPARAWLLWSAREADRGKPIQVTISNAAKLPQPAGKVEPAAPLVIVKDAAGRKLFEYYHGAAKAGRIPPLSDYIHPLFGLDGEVLTDLRPRDHIHHRGVFWPWVRHEKDGRSLGDWWHPMQITLLPVSLASTDGPVFVSITAEHDWISHTIPEKPLPFVRERVVMRAFPATSQGRPIDVDVMLTALVDGVSIGGTLELKKGYGGMSIRFAPATQPQIVADGQSLMKDANHLRAKWVDWSGVMTGSSAASRPAGRRSAASQTNGPNTPRQKGTGTSRRAVSDGATEDQLGASPLLPKKRSGTAILIHPSHPDFPPEWITRMYGVIGMAYPGLDMLPLPKDKPLRMRYRLWVHRGTAEEAGVADAYRAYAADWKWAETRAGN